MTDTTRLHIDLVTRKPNGDFCLVLVEEGPWQDTDVESRLRALQSRLNDCIDAALGGHVAAKYPASQGGRIVLRVDCYDTPRQATDEFLARFRNHLSMAPEVQEPLRDSQFVKGIELEHSWASIPELQAAAAAQLIFDTMSLEVLGT